MVLRLSHRLETCSDIFLCIQVIIADQATVALVGRGVVFVSWEVAAGCSWFYALTNVWVRLKDLPVCCTPPVISAQRVLSGISFYMLMPTNFADATVHQVWKSCRIGGLGAHRGWVWRMYILMYFGWLGCKHVACMWCRMCMTAFPRIWSLWHGGSKLIVWKEVWANKFRHMTAWCTLNCFHLFSLRFPGSRTPSELCAASQPWHWRRPSMCPWVFLSDHVWAIAWMCWWWAAWPVLCAGFGWHSCSISLIFRPGLPPSPDLWYKRLSRAWSSNGQRRKSRHRSFIKLENQVFSVFGGKLELLLTGVLTFVCETSRLQYCFHGPLHAWDRTHHPQHEQGKSRWLLPKSGRHTCSASGTIGRSWTSPTTWLTWSINTRSTSENSLPMLGRCETSAIFVQNHFRLEDQVAKLFSYMLLVVQLPQTPPHSSINDVSRWTRNG